MREGSPQREEYISSREGWKKKEVKREYDVPILPRGFRSLTKKWRGPIYESTMSYLRARGVTMEDITRMKIGYVEDGEYKNRVVFPSFDETGELNFFVGRGIYDTMRKYKHGNFDKDIIFNDYLIDWRKPVVITEGPFDALKAGDNAIPLQGTILTPDLKLYQKIVLSGVGVYFALDKDVFKKQLQIMLRMMSYGVRCWYVELGDHNDVGSMTKDQFLLAKNHAREVKSDSDVMKLRLCS